MLRDQARGKRLQEFVKGNEQIPKEENSVKMKDCSRQKDPQLWRPFAAWWRAWGTTVTSGGRTARLSARSESDRSGWGKWRWPSFAVVFGCPIISHCIRGLAFSHGKCCYMLHFRIQTSFNSFFGGKRFPCQMSRCFKKACVSQVAELRYNKLELKVIIFLGVTHLLNFFSRYIGLPGNRC